jgi:hypothetical protein
MRTCHHFGSTLGYAAVGLLAALFLPTISWAQSPESPPQGSVGVVARALLRTPADMADFGARHPNPPIYWKPYLPTIEFDEYARAKSVAPPLGATKPTIAGANAPLAFTHGVAKCNGLGQNQPVAQGFFPPDTHGAVGANHFGQVVNSGIQFYTKALTGRCPTDVVLSNTLAAFFGYSARALFDPRLLYDMTYHRWIVSVEAFEESSTVQYHFVAVSVDSDPTHGFFTYQFNARDWVGAGVFWDFPQIGYDEDAVILTGNKFNPGYVGSTPVFLPKHRLYNGLGFSYCWFNAANLNVGTLAPPIVLDQGPYTTIAVARVGANFIRVHKVVNTSHACPTFIATNDIATSIPVPPLAQQPGFANCTTDPAHCLDAGDGRFQSAGTQFGSPVFGSPVKFWQTNTGVVLGFPAPRTFRVNADTLTIEEACTVFASNTSFDFNPSIVTNGSGTIFMAWSSTDPAGGHNAQARFASKKIGDSCATLSPGILDKESPQALTGNFDSDFGTQRWGDYSAVTLDPFDGTQAWGVNEIVPLGTCTGSASLSCWKSHFGSMSNP